MPDLPPIVVVVGPTAAGKSELAIRLAGSTAGEVVSADSQQVYVGMDIGTGKVTQAERARVRHHLIDVVMPDEEMTAARFQRMADEVIADLAARDVPAIVCGGTMLYVRALLLGIFEGPPADPDFRAGLADTPAPELHARLTQIDPEAAERILPNDHKRIVRALEVHHLTGVTMSEHQRRHDFTTLPPRYPARLVGLAPADRETLYARIDARVDRMIAAGWLEEVRRLRAAGYGPELRSQQAIGYRELHAHIAGDLALDEAIRLTKRNSRRYARRQLGWYRGDDRVSWHTGPGSVDLGELGRYLRGG